jgi:hypothetical protein
MLKLKTTQSFTYPDYKYTYIFTKEEEWVNFLAVLDNSEIESWTSNDGSTIIDTFDDHCPYCNIVTEVQASEDVVTESGYGFDYQVPFLTVLCLTCGNQLETSNYEEDYL